MKHLVVGREGFGAPSSFRRTEKNHLFCPSGFVGRQEQQLSDPLVKTSLSRSTGGAPVVSRDILFGIITPAVQGLTTAETWEPGTGGGALGKGSAGVPGLSGCSVVVQRIETPNTKLNRSE